MHGEGLIKRYSAFCTANRRSKWPSGDSKDDAKSLTPSTKSVDAINKKVQGRQEDLQVTALQWERLGEASPASTTDEPIARPELTHVNITYGHAPPGCVSEDQTPHRSLQRQSSSALVQGRQKGCASSVALFAPRRKHAEARHAQSEHALRALGRATAGKYETGFRQTCRSYETGSPQIEGSENKYMPMPSRTLPHHNTEDSDRCYRKQSPHINAATQPYGNGRTRGEL